MILLTDKLVSLQDGVYLNEGVVDEDTLENIIANSSDTVLVRVSQGAKFLPLALHQTLKTKDNASFIIDDKLTEILRQQPEDSSLDLFVFSKSEQGYKIYKYRKRV